MSLFGEWQKRLENQNKNPENQMFFENYLHKETEAYKKILGSGITSLTGKLADLAETYDMDNVTFMGFLDGINTSLDSKLDLESLTGESHIDKAILHYSSTTICLMQRQIGFMSWRNGIAYYPWKSGCRSGKSLTKITGQSAIKWEEMTHALAEAVRSTKSAAAQIKI